MGCVSHQEGKTWFSVDDVRPVDNYFGKKVNYFDLSIFLKRNHESADNFEMWKVFLHMIPKSDLERKIDLVIKKKSQTLI